MKVENATFESIWEDQNFSIDIMIFWRIQQFIYSILSTIPCYKTSLELIIRLESLSVHVIDYSILDASTQARVLISLTWVEASGMEWSVSWNSQFRTGLLMWKGLKYRVDKLFDSSKYHNINAEFFVIVFALNNL